MLSPASLLAGGPVVLALTILASVGIDPRRVEPHAPTAFVAGVAGGMVGSFALVGALLFGRLVAGRWPTVVKP